MKNEETDAFEKRLSSQPLKGIPADWRAEILTAARKQQVQAVRHSAFGIPHWLSNILWPHPAAWGGLAAVWLVIFALNFVMSDKQPELAKASAAPSSEVLAELRQQHKLYAELMGITETHDADRQRVLSPKPRSEVLEILAA